jgi:hypothetical protein
MSALLEIWAKQDIPGARSRLRETGSDPVPVPTSKPANLIDVIADAFGAPQTLTVRDESDTEFQIRVVEPRLTEIRAMLSNARGLTAGGGVDAVALLDMFLPLIAGCLRGPDIGNDPVRFLNQLPGSQMIKIAKAFMVAFDMQKIMAAFNGANQPGKN